MKRATVVIGANYGDEGKGAMVDYLASQVSGEKVVVRFNGGAQAGHTVVTPDGYRHVFSHFGSGTLTGASTYLAKHFVCNPILFWKEFRILHTASVEPVVAVDPRCFVTTPFDMLINQIVEDARGDKRHGSVGVGFGETIERCQYPAFRLIRSDLTNRDTISERLRLIRDKWLPTRCQQLNVSPLEKNDRRLNDDLIGRIAEEFLMFAEATAVAGAEFLERKTVIFEGAQGLCLDMRHGQFPHVTRSSTGLANVVPIVKSLSLNIETIYMTRPYLTRHGAGSVPRQYVPDPPIFDETNTPHPYQGELRFGRLHIGELRQRIERDAALLSGCRMSVGLSCVDHVDAVALRPIVGDLKPATQSNGPTRNHISKASATKE